LGHKGQGYLKARNGKVDYVGKTQRVFDGIVKNLKFLGADGQILTAGKSGKVPPGQINGTGNIAEAFRYFYHPDHLGSTSYVTDASGEVFQHLEYFAFGETFVEEHSNTDRTPYLFNAKEFDEETGLYYFGARYYDPKTSVWQSVDPEAVKFPGWSAYTAFNDNPVLYKDPNGKTGEVTINKEAKTITVTSNIVFYGGSSNAALAKSTANDIQNHWNSAAGKVTIDGVEYNVKFVVTGEHRPDLTRDEVAKNKDIKQNFIRIEETSDLSSKGSYTDPSPPNTGANTGYYNLSEIKGEGSTTEAHEYGHGLAQEHADFGTDLRGKGQPPMGAARGTLVDAEYQYDPKAKAGEKGGTLNPAKRKVTQGDINSLRLDKLKFDSSGKANLGTLTNTYHEK
jgi:RHS repeat-associated protein